MCLCVGEWVVMYSVCIIWLTFYLNMCRIIIIFLYYYSFILCRRADLGCSAPAFCCIHDRYSTMTNLMYSILFHRCLLRKISKLLKHSFFPHASIPIYKYQTNCWKAPENRKLHLQYFVKVYITLNLICLNHIFNASYALVRRVHNHPQWNIIFCLY